ncbi:MAG: YmdB family metallophosphoesterase [Roseburia sp.]|nr:YmdB family metallophosphoesterase [Anaeroplasma bactoclasticum]MCM1195941.1 YmdB family metallophosphoesterase [Roseburia sp.]MCM1555917.1 YmdB family metallophosphoesterase [Anaeroplasma bactoclasticum]
MRILYLGDIVGEKTIGILKKHLEEIKKEYHIQMVLCNAENVTKGKGLSYAHYKELKSLGIAGMTMGNHTFSKSEIKEYMNDATIARPANLSTTIGKDVLYIQYNQETIALINLLGRVYLNTPLDCPFKTLEAMLPKIQADKIIVDFHGEATSEKKAFFYDFAGRVDAILGTHTHVKTDDIEVYKNTCYITDLGMCGPKYSVLGSDVGGIIERFKTGVYEVTKVSDDPNYILNGVILDFGKDNKIENFKKIIPAPIL